MKPALPTFSRRSLSGLFLAALSIATCARAEPPPAKRWRKLGLDEQVRPGDRYANQDPNIVAEILKDPDKFPGRDTRFFTSEVASSNVIGALVCNIEILSHDGAYWRYE